MKKEMIEEKNEEFEETIFDKLLDENNNDNIIIPDDKGNQIEWEQVALIPYGDDELYAVLRPVSKIEGVDESEVFVFSITEIDDEYEIKLEEDDKKVEIIIDELNELVKGK